MNTIHWVFIVCAVFAVLFVQYVIRCYMHLPKSKRSTPTDLIFVKVLATGGLVVSYFSMLGILIFDEQSQVSSNCEFWGFCIFVFFTATQGYFIGITTDLLQSLKNPFRNNNITPWRLHIIIWLWAVGINILVAITDGFHYKSEYALCTTCSNGTILNPYDVILLYAPSLLGSFLGIATTIKACCSLRGTFKETFKPKLRVITRQIFIVLMFTLFIMGIVLPLTIKAQKKRSDEGSNNSTSENSSLCLNDSDGPDDTAGILVCVNLVILCLQDAFAWWSIHGNFSFANISSTTLQSNKQANLSDALRTEIVSYITYGISQSVKIIARRTYEKSQKVSSSTDKANNDLAQHPIDQTLSPTNTEPLNFQENEMASLSSVYYSNKRKSHKENKEKEKEKNTKDKKSGKNACTPLIESPMVCYGGSNDNEQESIIKTSPKLSSISDINHTNEHQERRKESTELELQCSLEQITTTKEQEKKEKKMLHKRQRHLNTEKEILKLKEPSFNSYHIPLTLNQWKDKGEILSIHNTFKGILHYLGSLLCCGQTRQFHKKRVKDLQKERILRSKLAFNVFKVCVGQEMYGYSGVNEKPTEINIEQYDSAFNFNITNDSKEPELSNNQPLLPLSKILKSITETRVPMIAYAPHVFRYLRTVIYGIDDDEYLKAIVSQYGLENEAIRGKFSEGKSEAFLFFTHSWTYMIKTVTAKEAKILLEILPDLVDHFKNNVDSLINKYFGLYSIRMYDVQIYFVVLENIFLPEKPNETYDIKGSWIARHTNHFVESGKVMKDEDLHKNLKLNPDTCISLTEQLKKDSEFLQAHNIMDYSLLIGIYYTTIAQRRVYQHVREESKIEEKQKRKSFKNMKLHINKSLRTDVSAKLVVAADIVEGPGTYYIGIIDTLQKWDWKKKMERFVKIFLKCNDGNGISCVEPKSYRNRFLRKMENIGIQSFSNSKNKKKSV